MDLAIADGRWSSSSTAADERREQVRGATSRERTLILGAARAVPLRAYARVTERAALAGARWLGRADQQGAEEAAFPRCAWRSRAPINGRVVIGAPEERRRLAAGRDRRRGGEEVDLALDPLEGRAVVARGGNGAMSMIAVGEPGSMPTLPDMYMRKMAVGRSPAADLPPQADRRERPGDRRRVRPAT